MIRDRLHAVSILIVLILHLAGGFGWNTHSHVLAGSAGPASLVSHIGVSRELHLPLSQSNSCSFCLRLMLAEDLLLHSNLVNLSDAQMFSPFVFVPFIEEFMTGKRLDRAPPVGQN